MLTLIIGLVIFFGIHLLPSFPAHRQVLADRFGKAGYRILFSLVSFVGLGLIIYGKGDAEFVFLWQPPAWGQYAPFIMMLPAMVLFPAANMPGHIKRVVRHPMLIGILLWSVAHLLANGDQASILLFGGFALFAVFDLFSVSKRSGAISQADAQIKFDVIACLAGIILYLLVIYFHSNLFGPPVLL
jgi:uncharacterized membrane protein